MSGSMQSGVSALSPVDGHTLWNAPIGCQDLALGPDGTIYGDACSNVPRLCAADPVAEETKWCAITPGDPLTRMIDGANFQKKRRRLIVQAPQ